MNNSLNQKKKAKYIGWTGALLVHLLVILLLLCMGLSAPRPMEEGGMPVMLGDVPDAGSKPVLVPVEVEEAPLNEPQPAAEPDAPVTPTPDSDQPLITQEEESVAIKPEKKEAPKKETPKKVTPKKEAPKKETKKTTPQPVVKPTEKSEAEKAEEARKAAAAEEARKKQLAAEEAARKRKEAEEAARKKVAGAFGKGAQMNGQGSTEGAGKQGSPTGNASQGATQGIGGYGSFSLNGRSLGPGGLPRPVYNVQDEGKVVVSIVVNPEGIVISTSIHRETNTVNPALRKAAEDAARKARFNRVEGLNNQTGTITYYFNLK